MMKGLMQSVIILLIVIFSLQTVSAITVTSMTIDPPGALAPGTPVTVQFEVDTPSYPSPGEVRFFTDLDNPTWTYTIIVNGIENIRPVMGGHTLVISGFELSYRADDVVSVQATLEGTTPTVSSLSDQVILQISDVNSHGNITTVYTNYYHQVAPAAPIRKFLRGSRSGLVLLSIRYLMVNPTGLPTVRRLSLPQIGTIITAISRSML